ncbi:hypothetical protein ACOSP7_012854 [Xanthoceras sorbifolium]
MKMLTVLLLFALTLMALVAEEVYGENSDLRSRLLREAELDQETMTISTTTAFLRGAVNIMTCDKFPRICRQLKSSSGPDCCKKKCVDVRTDRLNCGMCGYKCKYNEICCKGKCVNGSFDRRHCGGCNKKCKKGEFCVYGMCNYA